MLVLSVKREGHVELFIGEGPDRLHLGSIQVLHASYGTVRLGFDIDKTLTVLRGEVVERDREAA